MASPPPPAGGASAAVGPLGAKLRTHLKEVRAKHRRAVVELPAELAGSRGELARLRAYLEGRGSVSGPWTDADAKRLDSAIRNHQASLLRMESAVNAFIRESFYELSQASLILRGTTAEYEHVLLSNVEHQQADVEDEMASIKHQKQIMGTPRAALEGIVSREMLLSSRVHDGPPDPEGRTDVFLQEALSKNPTVLLGTLVDSVFRIPTVGQYTAVDAAGTEIKSVDAAKKRKLTETTVAKKIVHGETDASKRKRAAATKPRAPRGPRVRTTPPPPPPPPPT